MPFSPRLRIDHRSTSLNEWSIDPVLDEQIAELFGIYAGDGCLAVYPRRTKMDYRFIISGAVEDLKYLEWVRSVIFDRFGFFGTLKERQLPGKHWFELICRSKEIVNYFSENGYLPGRKVDIGIPNWIKSNPNHSAAFLRGIFDTDGYFILLPKGRLNAYPKFTFMLKPKRFIQELTVLMQNLGFTPSNYLDVLAKDSRNGRYYEKNYAYLNGWKNFLLWRQKIGSSNRKNQAKLSSAYEIWSRPFVSPSIT